MINRFLNVAAFAAALLGSSAAAAQSAISVHGSTADGVAWAVMLTGVALVGGKSRLDRRGPARRRRPISASA